LSVLRLLQVLNEGVDGRTDVGGAKGLDTRNGQATCGRAQAGAGSFRLEGLDVRAAGTVLALTMGMAGSGMLGKRAITFNLTNSVMPP
jgi:hypothetical protein